MKRRRKKSEKKMNLFYTLVIITAMEATVRGQCPATMVIGKGTDEIKSPNFGSGGEYEKKANCTWKFDSTNWTNYALKVDVLDLRLYYVSGGSKICIKGSYNLTIAADRLNCQKFAREDRRNTFCHSYYNSYSCGDISEISDCEVSKYSEFPVEVKYEADGGTIDGNIGNAFDGFRMRYQFVECPEPTTTGNGIGSTTVSKDTSQTNATTGNMIGLTTVSKDTSQHATSTTPTVETTKSIPSTDSRETTTDDYIDTTTSASPTSVKAFPLPIVVGAAGGGAFLLVLLIVTVICIKRRSRPNRKPLDDSEFTSKDQDIQKPSDNIPMTNLEISAEEEPYTIMTGSSKQSTSSSDVSQTQTANDTLEVDPTYSLAMNPTSSPSRLQTDNPPGDDSEKDQVYTIVKSTHTTPPSSKSEDTQVYTIVNPTHTTPPSNTTEDTQVYTIVNPTLTAPPQNKTEDTYTEINKSSKSTRRIKATSTKKKKSQIIPEEQESTYSEISNTHSSAATTDRYTSIKKGSKKAKSKKIGKESSITKRENEIQQDETYSEIRDASKSTSPPQVENSDSTSGAVYAAVTNESGKKGTMHYEKEMVDNVLYGTSSDVAS